MLESPYLWPGDNTTEPTYVNWATSEPDLTLSQYCGEVLLSNGQWADDYCYEFRGVVCKMEISKAQ